jgi:predicted  nucleic acid-binding Zn-ribbon protein
MRLSKWLLAGTGLVGIGFAASVAAQGGRTAEPEVLSALLGEVRGLRLAIEQMASAGPRIQLALGRLQLQEQRLNTMLRRLETLRDSTAGAERGVSQLEAQLARMQEDFKAAETRGDAPDERALAYEMRQLRRQLDLARQDQQRWQAEEAQLQQQIAAEQARWTEINRSLEDLERALGKR